MATRERMRTPEELRPTSRRLESFSDGVFAIVITIMVFEIRVPESLAFANDPAALQGFATILATYTLSFTVIANLWTSHHYLVFTVANPSRSTIWLNNLLLFWITLIPIVTRFLGMNPSSPRAAAAYGAVSVGATAAFMLLRSHAARMTHNELHRQIHQRVLQRTWLFLSIYVASIPLAFVSPWLAWTCFLVVPPMLFLPVIRGRPAAKTIPRERRDIEHSCP
jgi:uncharacterized membrane protein